MTALTERGGPKDRDEWLALAGDCQALVNTLTAVQDTAIAEVARRESDWCDDGTLGEKVYGQGRVTLEAADLVAPVIGASHAQAQRRVEQAVRLAAGRSAVNADDREAPEASGLTGLHAAMASGRLDGYRAGVVAFELEVAPAEVADAIVAALSGHLDADASSLRRRTRVLLSRISPDLVRERAKRALASTGLRRWVAEPGVDEWHGTFPSEDAAAAWTAIDRLAHDLVATGTCSNIEQARGKALTDLVIGNATVEVQVVLTVPVDATTSGRTDHQSPAAATPAQLSASGGTGHATTQAATPAEATAVGPTGDEAAQASPLAEEATSVPAAPSGGTATHLGGATHSTPDDSDDDLVQVQGARPSEPLLVRRGWLRQHLAKRPPEPGRGARRDPQTVAPCDPLTGARLDPGGHLATDAYRPGKELAALVRARDGRCRFPGCSVAARFCDLDHVRPWPIGPTAAHNLLTLCRRHHRIKQRPGWRVRVASDATATWADPTGRVRTTAPLDALQALVLCADRAHAEPPVAIESRTVRAADPMCGGRAAPDFAQPTRSWSALETHHALRLEHAPDADRGHDLRSHPTHRRCTSAADLRSALARRRASTQLTDVPPF